MSTGMRSSRRAYSLGFTLLELLVALAIMGMSLALLYRASGSGARNVADIEAYQGAVMVGQSLLDQRSSVSAGGWSEAGVDGGYAWRVASAVFPTSASGPGIPPLHAVDIRVEWGQPTRSLLLRTLKPERQVPVAGPRP